MIVRPSRSRSGQDRLLPDLRGPSAPPGPGPEAVALETRRRASPGLRVPRSLLGGGTSQKHTSERRWTPANEEMSGFKTCYWVWRVGAKNSEMSQADTGSYRPVACPWWPSGILERLPHRVSLEKGPGSPGRAALCWWPGWPSLWGVVELEPPEDPTGPNTSWQFPSTPGGRGWRGPGWTLCVR